MENKKKWEDWVFYFSLQDENWSVVDLNWYEYSIVIEAKWWEEILRESWIITETAQELIKTIPADTTKDLSTFIYGIEYKIKDTNWNTFISSEEQFQCIWTLHYN